MISVEKAIETIDKTVISSKKSTIVELSQAAGLVLYNDIYSPINMPPFRQSAMDGYAIHIHDSKTYNLIGEIKAGDNFHPELKAGDAVRIFTGAPVPDTSNAVIMQEKVVVNNIKIELQTSASINENIRRKGEQVQKEAIALKKNTKLTPAAIAFLTSLGITKVSVYDTPKITIVVTGNELAEAGTQLDYGQIYESNALMLQSALKELGYQRINISKVADNYEDTYNLLKSVITTSDVVLVSGGISVGDYDFVGKALNELQVEQLFYKVKQKPGKPLFFGKKESALIFALPGNPAAALSCFYIYVHKALERLSGNENFQPLKTRAISKTNYTKKGDRGQFLKAIYTNGKVEILDGQSSAMLQTFALANALVYLPESQYVIENNSEVEVILLPKTL